jgi:ApeA N-terminal domain 1
MKLDAFEDWFAVRIEHSEDETWPGWLQYDPVKGISLDTTNFASPEHWYSHPTFNSSTVTGYLDFQRPATLIAPFIRSSGGGILGKNALHTRARYNVVANHILKNFHLTDINKKCFAGFRVNLPVIHAWRSPELVRVSYSRNGKRLKPKIGINTQKPLRAKINGGIEITLHSQAWTKKTAGDLKLDQMTSLEIIFPKSIELNEIFKLSNKIETVFSFLIGSNLHSPAYFLATEVSASNKNERKLDFSTELWSVPAFKRDEKIPDGSQCLFSESSSEVLTSTIIEKTISGEFDKLVPLMNATIRYEMADGGQVESFNYFTGCLEDFDKNYNGSGADRLLSKAVKKIDEHLSLLSESEMYSAFKRMKASYSNQLSLKGRLERLHKTWKTAGFRTDPDPSKIVKLRNLSPHGRGHEIGIEEVRRMHAFNDYMAALARFHVFRKMGYSTASICESFTRKVHRYGFFIPEEYRVTGGQD